MAEHGRDPETPEPGMLSGSDSTPSSARKQVRMGTSAYDREDYKAAIHTFRDVLAEYPGFADVRNKAGLSLAMVGRLEEALEQFDAALGINPNYSEAHLNRAIVLNELERFDEARESFIKAGDSERSWSGDYPAELGNRLAISHARLGDLYLEAGRPIRAADEYEEALNLRPTFLDVRSRLAEAYLQLGEVERAGRELEAILEANPDFVSARIRLGVVLRRLGDIDGAAREWSRAERQDPSDTRARAYLATLGSG